jgi:hypothetical protein
MVSKLRAGKLTAATKAAFEQGGFDREIINALSQREGRGRGKRASQLTETERSFLARLEHSIANGDGYECDLAGGQTGGLFSLPHPNVSGASNGAFADVSDLPEWEM